MHSYMHLSKKEQNKKKNHIQSKVACIHKCILQKEQIKKNQQKILLEKGLNVVSTHSTTRMYNLSDII